MSIKFDKGDTVSFEATVTRSDAWGVWIDGKSGERVVLPAVDLKLVKKATPPAPRVGTVIRLGSAEFGAKYIVGPMGDLTYISSSTGTAHTGYGNWSNFDHSAADIVVLG